MTEFKIPSLQEQLAKMEKDREEIKQRLFRTKAEGDLRENSGYEQAMNDLQVINIRINNLIREMRYLEGKK